MNSLTAPIAELARIAAEPPVPRFDVIPPDDKGYSGMTKLWLSDTVAVAAMATGPEVEGQLRDWAKERGHG